MSSDLPLTTPLTEAASAADSSSSVATAALASALFTSIVASVKTSAASFSSSSSSPTSSPTTSSSLKSHLIQLKRELPKLVDVREYGKPASAEEAMQRVRANARFFRSTYTLVFVCVFASFVLANPGVFVASVVLCALWGVFLSEPQDAVLKLGSSVELKRGEKLVALISLTVIIIFFSGLVTSVLYVLFVWGALVSVHGSLRRPVELDALEQLEQEGEQIKEGGGDVALLV